MLGHRGAREEAPENTLAAFERSRELGADGVELDVRLDGSGRVIVLHDRTLSRVTDGREARDVERMDARALESVALAQGARVPTLAATLAWAGAHGQRVNVELKHDVSDKAALVRGVARALEDARECSARVLLSSFDPRLVRALARRLPQLPVAWLVHAGQRVLRAAPGWRLLGAAGVNPEHVLLDTKRASTLRARGALIATWTVNEPDDALRVANLGVDAIISDRPGAVLAVLQGERPRS